MHARLENEEERNKKPAGMGAQWGGEASREIVRRLNRFDSRPDRFCNEHPRDRLISGCGFYSLSVNRAPRFLPPKSLMPSSCITYRYG